MRILQLCSYFLPHKGGIEYVVYNLSREFVRLGHEVTVVSSLIGTDIKEEMIDGIKIKRVRAFPILKSPFSFSLFFKLMKEKPDVIHVHHPHPFFLETGIVYAKIFRIPIVMHCYAGEITITGWKNIFAQIYNNIFLRSDMRMADRVISLTQKMIHSSVLLNNYRNKTRILAVGIDTKHYSGKIRSSFKKELRIEKDKIILFVGVLREYKRIDILINAVNSIIKECPNTKLVIVGAGDKESELKALVNRLKLEQQIIFAGFVEDNKLLEYYSIADVFVLPSPNIEESFGLVALEAAAMEMPVIVTEGAGISEVFKEENIGIIIEPYSIKAMKDAILEVLNNQKEAKLCVKKLKRIVCEKYSWDKLAVEYLKLYKEVIPPNRP